MAALEYAKGRCPECGRVISGRATGIEYDAVRLRTLPVAATLVDGRWSHREGV